MQDSNFNATQDATALVREALRAHQSGDVTRAENLSRNVLRIDPGHAEAFRLLGLAALKAGRNPAARDYLEQALSLDCRHADAALSLAEIYARSGDLAAADATLQQAIDRRGPLPELFLAAGDVAGLRNRNNDAETLYRRCLDVDPSHTRAWYNLGVRLADRGAQREAADAFQQALRLDPDFADAHFNRALLMSELGRPDTAVAHYTEYLRVHPADAQARFFRALERLRAGDYANGWPEYESRWAHQPDDRSRIPFPQWNGQPLAGRRVFVHSEQGLGDEIMFASCFDDLIATAAYVCIECDPRLVPLFARSFPKARVVSRCHDPSASLKTESVDFSLSAGTLPQLFRCSSDAFPQRAAYLHADTAERASFRKQLEQLGPGIKVGISWRGGEKPGARRRKSTKLSQWAPLLADPRVELVNLQYDTRPGEIETLAQQLGRPLHDVPGLDPRRDFDRFAALVAALDLVISVSNTTVHAAGALGVPTWLLLSVAGEWRWQTAREDALWYPSVRIFRQERPGEWDSVFSSVARAIQALKPIRLSDRKS